MLSFRGSAFRKVVSLNAFSTTVVRGISTDTLRRSYLYVPASSDRMLEKSRTTDSDMIIYDLEDSVAPFPLDKEIARGRLRNFLNDANVPAPERVAVRINDITTPYFKQDIQQVLSLPGISTLVLPKIHSAQDLHQVSTALYNANDGFGRSEPIRIIRIIPSIESARAMFNLGGIAGWASEHGPLLGGELSGLLFAAEDYCANTSIIRTPSRRELLSTRSQIVVAAKAFNLEAIDMVCINYKDLACLKEECQDGRQLGFTGKQAIHPGQVEIIRSTFVPTAGEIVRAAKILSKMKQAHENGLGAMGLDGEMIDAPMLKQATNVIRTAEAAGLDIPEV